MRAANSGIFHEEVGILIAIRRDDDMPRVLKRMKLELFKDWIKAIKRIHTACLIILHCLSMFILMYNSKADGNRFRPPVMLSKYD